MDVTISQFSRPISMDQGTISILRLACRAGVVAKGPQSKDPQPPSVHGMGIGPVIVGIVILLGLVLISIFRQPATPTPTPVILPSMTLAATFTSDPDTPTVIPTVSSTASPTVTFTPSTTLTPTTSPTLTPSRTNQPFDMILFCVNSQYANTINVRSGPGTIYAPIGDPKGLPVKKCLNFSARNEEATWLQIRAYPERPNS